GPVHVEALRRAGQTVVGILGSSAERSQAAAVALAIPRAYRSFDELLAGAVRAIPDCRGAAALRALVRSESERLVPKSWVSRIRAAQTAPTPIGA
ncbi:MAG: hypothetical protein ACOYMX_07630, partial [Burkholderiales bacterium]